MGSSRSIACLAVRSYAAPRSTASGGANVQRLVVVVLHCTRMEAAS